MWFDILKGGDRRINTVLGQYKAFLEEDIKKYLDEKTLEMYGYGDDTLEDVIKRRREEFGEKDFPSYKQGGYYELSEKYNIPADFAQRVFRSYRGSNPIKSLEDYDRAKRNEIERKQKAIMRQRQKNRPPRKKGQRKQFKQSRKKKGRSERQASAQKDRDKQSQKDRDYREAERRKLRNIRRGL